MIKQGNGYSNSQMLRLRFSGDHLQHSARHSSALFPNSTLPPDVSLGGAGSDLSDGLGSRTCYRHATLMVLAWRMREQSAGGDASLCEEKSLDHSSQRHKGIFYDFSRGTCKVLRISVG